MNRKGADKIISVYWFVILFLVAGAIIYMTGVFYGKPYDVREVEANILINQIADCLGKGGYLKKGVFEEDFKNNFLGKCNLNFGVEDYSDWSNDQFYILISVLDLNLQIPVHSFEEGNENLKRFCEMKGEKLPVCVERSFLILDKENNQYEIKILSVVRKTEKNVM